MLRLEHKFGLIALIGALALSTSTPAFAQENKPQDSTTQGSTAQGSKDAGEQDNDTYTKPSDEQGPSLPEGKTLDEVLERAAQPPPASYPETIPDDAWHAFLLVEQLEYRFDGTDRPDEVGTDLEGWLGGDYNRLWFKNEGSLLHEDGGVSGDTENDLVYSRLISPFWYAQIGAQYANEWTPNDYEDLWSGEVALEGIAPGDFEVEGTLFVSQHADVTFGFLGSYDLWITQRLVLQPRVEFTLSAQDIPERNIGIGLTDVTVGLRLRYEIAREFAPYLGGRYQTLIGKTADMADADGEDTNSLFLVGGIRFALL